jgi:hypothetical protein
MLRRTTQHAQALVEFAIASTLILLLLAAAVDLGLVFMNLQGINNAAQEGALYGSRFLKVEGDKTELDYDAIRQRVRRESGAAGGFGFVNMQDLNSDGIPDAIKSDSNGDGTPDAMDDNGDGRFDRFQYGVDVDGDGQLDNFTGLVADGSQPGGYRRLIQYDISEEFPDLYQYGRDTNGDGRFDEVTGLIPEGSQPAGYTRVTENYIRVDALQDVNRDGDPTNDADAATGSGVTPCPSLVRPEFQCFVRVTVLSDHQTVFPLIDPVWDDKVPLRSQFVMPMRVGFEQPGAPTNTAFVITNTPVTPTSTHTPTNTQAPPTSTATVTNTRDVPVQQNATATPTNTRRPTSTPCRDCTPTNTRTPRPATNTPRPATNTPRPANTQVPPTITPRPTRSGS